MRFLSRIPTILGGLMMAALCACDTRVTDLVVLAPSIEVPTEEPVSMPVQVTAREAPPPDMG